VIFRWDSPATVTSAVIQDFLSLEADLLDSWQLEEWLGLFREDGSYEIPTTDLTIEEQLEGSPDELLFIVSDNFDTLKGRVKRLLSRDAYAESPHSRTRRLVTNARILKREGDAFEIKANFAIHRFKHGAADLFVGQYRNLIVWEEGQGLRFRRRRAILDNEALRPMGKVSIIL
jgi:p-cumate 2,3-dioxygenase beta subunit